uniref:Glutathione S-transferase 1, isoform D n=1 Tax=Lygus hesperus TaxID=30085 RepID=A0A146LCG7_LYGHE
MGRTIHILLLVALAAVGSQAWFLPKCPLRSTPKPAVDVTVKAKKPDLYYIPPSPPCRIIMMTVNVLGIDVNWKYVDLMKQEQLKPEFLKINPQHTVPAMNDTGFTLGESRAIQMYLAQKSPEGEKIYPKDIKKRAKIEEMLYFDVGRLYPQFLACYGVGTGDPSDENKKKFADSLGMLEEYIKRNNGWVATDKMTIADLSLLGTVTLTEAVGYDTSGFPKITEWLAKAKEAVPEYHTASQIGLDVWKGMYEAGLKPKST